MCKSQEVSLLISSKGVPGRIWLQILWWSNFWQTSTQKVAAWLGQIIPLRVVLCYLSSRWRQKQRQSVCWLDGLHCSWDCASSSSVKAPQKLKSSRSKYSTTRQMCRHSREMKHTMCGYLLSLMTLTLVIFTLRYWSTECKIPVTARSFFSSTVTWRKFDNCN